MYNVSVVIPTLGGNHIYQTINTLNNGSLVPNEILICIPSDLSYKVKCLDYKNVRIIETDRYGQVYQRIQGFINAINELVLQLDDDIFLDKYCLEKMSIAFFDLNDKKIAVCPVYFDGSFEDKNLLIKNSFYQNLVSPKNVYQKIKNFLIHGNTSFKDGVVTQASVNIHFDPSNKNEKYYNVDWLPGGCVLHYKENLYLENYFIFSGKAYCEDIIHSFLLRQNGINLYVSNYSFCSIDLGNELVNRSDFEKIKYIWSEFRARLLYSKLSKSSIIKLILFYFSIYFHLPYTYLKNRIK